LVERSIIPFDGMFDLVAQLTIVATSWFYNLLENIFLLKITAISKSTRIKMIWDKDKGSNLM